MSPFVWFHTGSEDPQGSARFYEKLLGWKAAEGPGGLTMLAAESGPFASVAAKHGAPAAWVPYVQVADVDDATRRASDLGAKVVQARTKGPAGDFTMVRDPGGAVVALWQKA